MGSRIADLFREREEHNKKAGEKMERTMTHALEKTAISVSGTSIHPNSVEMKIDMTEIIESLNDQEEFDGVTLTQRGTAKIKIEKEYTAGGGQKGNGNRS